MARRENIESIDVLLRDLCLLDVPFGGKVVVFGDDFRQTVPIVPKKSQQEIIGYSLVSFHLWPLFIRSELSVNSVVMVQSARTSNHVRGKTNPPSPNERHGEETRLGPCQQQVKPLQPLPV